MYIKRVYLNHKKVHTPLPCKTAQDAVEALKQLDGKKGAEIDLEGGTRTMYIAGPVDSRYIVMASMTGKGVCFLNDHRKQKNGKTLKIRLCGLLGESAERQTGDLTMASEAAKVFAATGKLSKSLKWR